MSSSHTSANGRRSDRNADFPQDGRRNGDSLDGPNGIGSKSSSAANRSLEPSRPNNKWVSTPLTSSESSPPKGTSPFRNGSPAKYHLNGASQMQRTPNGSTPQSAAATPMPSTPRDRKSAIPPPGEAKGYRVVWDPELDSKLGKEEKRKMKPKLKHFGSEVRQEIYFIT